MTPDKLRNTLADSTIANASQEELISLINQLKEKLSRRNQELTRTRERLSNAKARIQKLKGIVNYQRERIIELHT